MRTIRYALLASLVGFGIAMPVSAQTSATSEPPPAEAMGVFQRAGILIFQTPDERFQWWLDGRVNLDSAYYFNSDNQLSNGIELRRARFALNMVLWQDWMGQLDVDLVDNVVDVKDAWIGYRGVSNALIPRRSEEYRAWSRLMRTTSS